MRYYYIYKSISKFIESKNLYKQLPFEYIGYVHGTKTLYDLWKRGLPWDRPVFCNSFGNGEPVFLRNPCDKYIILDEKGRIRDFHELTDRHIPSYQFNHSGHRAPRQDHYGPTTIPEMSQTITPEEIREIKDEYGITLRPCHPKRTHDSWGESCFHKISKGWKKQSKRKHQYKDTIPDQTPETPQI